MQFVSHRDPVAQSGWGTALGATGDAIQNILSIYGGYQKQKRADAQQSLENKWREDEMRMREEERKRNIEMQDLNLAISKYDMERKYLKEGVPGARPIVKTGEETVDAAPDFQVNSKPEATKTDFGADLKLPSLTAFGATPPPATQTTGDFGQSQPPATLAGVLTQSMQPQPQFALDLKQPTAQRDVMGAAPVEQKTVESIMHQGKEWLPGFTAPVRYEDEIRKEQLAADLEKQINDGSMTRLSEGEKAILRSTGNPSDAALAERGVLPTTTYNAAIRPQKTGSADKIFDKATGRYLEKNPETGKYDVLVGQVTPEREKAEKDPFAIPAGAALVVAGNLDTVPPGLRAQVKAIADGRQAPPALGNRPGSPGFQLMAYVNAYDPEASFEATAARWKAHQELNRGGPTSRGGQTTNLNTFADHLDVLQRKAKALNDSLAGSNWQTLNQLNQKMTRSGKKGPISAYESAVNTFVTEYIKTLKGGSPTNQEQAEFERLRNPTISPAERQAAIDTLKEFVESRANEQETWYTQSFGRTSADDRDAGVKGRPFLGGRWVWDGTKWSIKLGGEHVAPSATQSNRTDTGGSTAEDWYRDSNGNIVRRPAK